MPPKKTPPEAAAVPLRPIRTYESDVAEVLEKENITKEKIAVAEEKRREKHDAAPLRAFTAKRLSVSNVIPEGVKRFAVPWKLVGIAAGVLLLLGMGLFLYRSIDWRRTPLPEAPKTPATPAQYSIVTPAGSSRAIFLDTVAKGVTATPLKVGEFKTVPLLREEKPLSTEELFAGLNAEAPSSLVRALDPSFTFGLAEIRGPQPFLIFRVRSYDYVTGGMREWEKRMLDDIGPMFGVNIHALSFEVGTTSAEVLEQNFRLKDAIIRNMDVRALFSAEGSIMFVYAFTDKETLVITTSEDSLRALQGRAVKGGLTLPAANNSR
jgi:hypothetical protein